MNQAWRGTPARRTTPRRCPWRQRGWSPTPGAPARRRCGRPAGRARRGRRTVVPRSGRDARHSRAQPFPARQDRQTLSGMPARAQAIMVSPAPTDNRCFQMAGSAGPGFSGVSAAPRLTGPVVPACARGRGAPGSLVHRARAKLQLRPRLGVRPGGSAAPRARSAADVSLSRSSSARASTSASPAAGPSRHRHGDRAVQRHHRRGRQPQQDVVEQHDPRPSPCRRPTRSPRGTRRSPPARRRGRVLARPSERSRALPDRDGSPTGPSVAGPGPRAAPASRGRGPRREARGRQLEQRQQPRASASVGRHVGQHPRQPEGFVRQVDPDQLASRRTLSSPR